MHQIGIGRAYSVTAIRMLIHEKETRGITTSGELLKELTFDEEKITNHSRKDASQRKGECLG